MTLNSLIKHSLILWTFNADGEISCVPTFELSYLHIGAVWHHISGWCRWNRLACCLIHTPTEAGRIVALFLAILPILLAFRNEDVRFWIGFVFSQEVDTGFRTTAVQYRCGKETQNNSVAVTSGYTKLKVVYLFLSYVLQEATQRPNNLTFLLARWRQVFVLLIAHDVI